VGGVDERVKSTACNFEVEWFLHSFSLFKTNFNVAITDLKSRTQRGIILFLR
jgi:hypothetical protein